MLPKKSTRSYHHGDLRAQALAAAKERLAAPDHSDFSLPEIARTLGVSHAALYRHFSGKKGLLAELALEGYQEWGTTLARSIKRSGGGVTSLEAAARAYLRFARRERALFRAMFNPLLHDKASHPELERAAAEAFSVWVDLVDGLKASLAVSPKIFVAVFWSAVHGAAVLENEGWLPGRSGLRRGELERSLPDNIATLLFNGASRD